MNQVWPIALLAAVGIIAAIAVAPKCELSQSQNWLRAGQIVQSCGISKPVLPD